VNAPALAGLVLLALLLRVAYVSLANPMPLRSDASGYDAAARRLVATGSYAYPVGRDLWDEDVFREASWDIYLGRPANAFSMPGYAWFLAAIYRVGGATPGRLLSVRLAQAFLGALTVVWVFLIADSILGRRAAWAAAALQGLYPPGIWASGYLLTETLFTWLIGGQLAAMTWAARSGRVAAYALVGIATSAAFYVRPVAALLPLLNLVHDAVRLRFAGSPHVLPHGLVVRYATLGLAFVLLVAPWAARNQRRYGVLMPTTSAAALPIVQGRLIARGLPIPTGTIPQLADLSPFSYDDHAYAERTAARIAARIPPASPGEHVDAALRRLGMLSQALTSPFDFFSTPVPIASGWFAMQSALLALALLGLWRHRGDLKVVVLLGGVPVAFVVVHWLVSILWSRYLYPSMPMVLMLAGAGLVALAPLGGGRRRLVGRSHPY